jgi:hypothetical protein
MSIKGIKEALAKKLSAQDKNNQSPDKTDVKINKTPPVVVGNGKPLKKSAGRGR